MNKSVLYFVSIFTFFLSGTLSEGREDNVPEIFFKEKSHIAGEVMEGDIIEHTFTVYNRGNGVLKINRVKPG